MLAESALLGLVGSVLGLARGTAMAALALRWLAGDLGGGYFPGVAPTLQWSAASRRWCYGVLGVVAALVGGWLPARTAQRMAPAQALKGLGGSRRRQPGRRLWAGAAGAGRRCWRCAAGGGLPLAAYVSVALLLLGGIACVPAAVGLRAGAAAAARHDAAGLLAIERARHQRHAATVAVAGVVASLAWRWR